MSIGDGFWLWIGKALADLALFAGVLVLFVIVIGIMAWRQVRRDRKIRDTADGGTQG
jgi:hypothetical protein